MNTDYNKAWTIQPAKCSQTPGITGISLSVCPQQNLVLLITFVPVSQSLSNL